VSEPQQPFDARTEREWQLQERARHAERAGAAHDGGDARAAEYRLLARVLRDPPLAPLPVDLARQTAVLAERAADAASERWLLRFGLVAAAAVIVAGIVFVGPQWSAVVVTAWGDPAAAGALHWGLAVLGCLSLSSFVEHWRRGQRLTR
jgi:cobalamin biosynthesis protein CobD/CbiB